ncbi:MAG: hypothetical protein K0R05_2472 [Anaerocolumna sp.]|jgi:uncharacterized protein YihD (DUF1040 family)|nr:hypothetical protein [Anaerocolumna sp.]
MKILSHRGYWNDKIGKNSFEAFKQSIARGYGFESDIRDFSEELVISHNPASSDCLKVVDIFQLLKEYEDSYTFAINVKADGLNKQLKELLKGFNLNNYFTFDMSFPQMLEYSNDGIIYYTRQSEFEIQPLLYEQASGVWIDAFYDEKWITEDLIKKHISSKKKVCIVSPELHNRQYNDFWNKIKMFDIDSDEILLCTDVPDKARIFFENF